MKISERQLWEALDLIQEEAAEIIQAISKMRRFGYDSTNPYVTDSKTNWQQFVDEVGDISTLIGYLVQNSAISPIDISDRVSYKESKLKNYTRLYEDVL